MAESDSTPAIPPEYLELCARVDAAFVVMVDADQGVEAAAGSAEELDEARAVAIDAARVYYALKAEQDAALAALSAEAREYLHLETQRLLKLRPAAVR